MKHTVCPLLLIGAQKSGTSYLYDLLVQDPCIAKSSLKEPKIFSKHVNTNSSFDSFFDYNVHHSYALDASASYMHVGGTADRVAATLGTDIPIIVILRNPLERAISGYFHEVKHGRETRLPSEVFSFSSESLHDISMEEREKAKDAWKRGLIQPHNSHEKRYFDQLFQFCYIRNSCYEYQLEPWLKKFSKVAIVDFHELMRNSDLVVRRVRQWIGLTTDFVVQERAAKNVTSLKLLYAIRENRTLQYDYKKPVPLLNYCRLFYVISKLKLKKPVISHQIASQLLSSFDTFKETKSELWI